jgi:sugar O-acyltransferase (sialic acid O-acetyltransferase NeuD family)
MWAVRVTQRSILLLGAGGHARACVDVIEQEGRFAIGGLLGLPEEVGLRVLGYPVVGTDEDVANLGAKYDCAFVTIGQIKTPSVRMRLFASLEALGVELPTVISPRAYVSPYARVGIGTIIMHGAIVNAGALIGRNCILNSHSLVEHDVVLGDHCHVSTAAAINSGVRVGNGSFIGSGSTVRQGLVIGERCLVGMGQSVLADCASGSQLPPRRNT